MEKVMVASRSAFCLPQVRPPRASMIDRLIGNRFDEYPFFIEQKSDDGHVL